VCCTLAGACCAGPPGTIATAVHEIEVALARGPLRPLPMRLEIDRWSAPSMTALELIPCQRVRPTATYFRSGHLLLDSLTHSLRQHLPAQHLNRVHAASSTSQVPAANPSRRTALPPSLRQQPVHDTRARSEDGCGQVLHG
jgi:hypothetical protein